MPLQDLREVRWLCNQGEEYLRAGEFDKAVGALQQALPIAGT